MTSTYVVGWTPFHRDAGSIELACRFARSTGARLHVVSVLPSGWGGIARRDPQSAEAEAERALHEARSVMDAAGVEGETVATTGRSVPQTLLDAVRETEARCLVLGSGTEAGIGHIDVSSKAGRLLHSSPVAVAVAPRGYRGKDGKLSRVTCAYRDHESSEPALNRAAILAEAADVPLRVVTFGVEPRRMVPTEVSGDAEMVLEQWRTQAAAALDRAIASLPDDQQHTGDIFIGRTWDEALNEADWEDGDVLIVGSSSTSQIAQVFLGSSATKIVRQSPVPVVVVPSRTAD
ncbi:universal stress protein [Mobilicoccus massiliensis]|uniref:universal stress protein n=1 Tax=Mobilicoccus massiliensis TaxID=1522310 RepID=UPI00058F4C12|nr:universal stress protein [Mobilicoccus massiliensis]